MDNGTSPAVIEHFNRVALLPDNWDHNRQYQNGMLRRIPQKTPESGLEIGCGTGEFCRKLAQRCRRVIGIDVAPGMIAEAKKRNAAPNIEYINTDAASFLAGRENAFDVITSIAAFHHMDMEQALLQCKRALKDGGVLVIQDLYQENTLIFKLLSLLGAVVNPFFMLVQNGRLRVTKEERRVWAAHLPDDVYGTFAQIRALAAKTLGTVQMKRHIFWRYTLAYQKPFQPEKQ